MRSGLIGEEQARQFRVGCDATRIGKAHGAPTKPDERQGAADYKHSVSRQAGPLEHVHPRQHEKVMRAVHNANLD